ncbi:hypothetical protein ACHAWF_003513, partial [Thalassiosira exigua]
HRNGASDASVASRRSTSSAARNDEGAERLAAGDCAGAVSYFTRELEAAQNAVGRRGADKLASLRAGRCEALSRVGAHEASARDARKALELSDGAEGGAEGAALRAEVLCLLGTSLSRRGISEGATEAFEESLRVADDAPSDAAKDVAERASEGLASLRRCEVLRAELDAGKYKKEYLDALDEALDIAPASIEWQVAKVSFLAGRRRWFAVANCCERIAARAVRCDGLFEGDLADANPFPDVPPARDLDADFFAPKDDAGDAAPPHLRTLSPNAARDAAFRLPPELLPQYLRALRLEERYKAAVAAGTALAEFDVGRSSRGGDVGGGGDDTFAENRRFHQEWDKLDRTIKLKEEGDLLFRDAYYERAVALYGECLAIDGEVDGSSILRQSSSWPVASPKANGAGGKLHAVLHSNRAACFSSMGRYDDAVKEASHAIDIHSMYTKAILRRARCRAKLGRKEEARSDYDRYVALVEGARRAPYPPPNQGSACYFDMPSDVSRMQLDAVQREMDELGLRSTATRNGSGDFMARLRNLSCCTKNAQSQVVTSPFSLNSVDDSDKPGRRLSGGRRVSFSDAPDKPPLIKSRPAFDHPIDAPSVMDANTDYYEALGLALASSTSNSDVKHAYHKVRSSLLGFAYESRQHTQVVPIAEHDSQLAREFHPDRNSSKEAQRRFQEIQLAYTILGDADKRREYDRARARLDP